MTDEPDDGELLFSDEEAESPAAPQERWTVMVVDDDADVHNVTELALSGFTFAGMGLRILHAYSGKEARSMIAETPETAVMLLDVVMEHEHAGLDVVEHVRDHLRNQLVRIVLRTGQPGAAPEKDVIARYDINDYKEKTELTARKLFTLMHSCLRSYRDIMTIERNKQALAAMLESSATLFRLQSFETFTNAVLQQMDALLQFGSGSLYGASTALAERAGGEVIEIVAGTGRFLGTQGRSVSDVLPSGVVNRMIENLSKGQSGQIGDDYVLTYRSSLNRDKILYLQGFRPIGAFEEHLLGIFSRNVGVAFDNVHLQQALESTQREIAWRLGGAIETRSRETGNHIRRVTRIARLLADRLGLPTPHAEAIEAASPLHDIGKIAIPDAILNKPGKLTDDEYAQMKEHARLGWAILAGAETEVLRLAAVVALEHHEHFNGRGYPDGKVGTQISLEGRMVAIADVLDALGSRRPYKEPWPAERIENFFREQRGQQFDPDLTDILLQDFASFLQIRELHPD